MSENAVYDTPPWQLEYDNPRWAPSPHGGGTLESQRQAREKFLADKAAELAKQRAAQKGGGGERPMTGTSYMNSILSALESRQGQTYRDQYKGMATAAQGAFSKPGADVRGHYWSFDPVAQGYKIHKLPRGKAFIGDLEVPTGDMNTIGKLGYYTPSRVQAQFVNLPREQKPFQPFRPSSGGGGSEGFSAPSADFNIRANLGGLKPMVAMPTDPRMSPEIASQLAQARQRTIVNMAKQGPYSLWGGR